MKIRKIWVSLGSLFLASLLAMFFVAAASATTINVGNGIIPELGSTTTVSITLDEAPDGLSGYTITVTLADPTKAEIMAVEFPSWASMNDNSALPSDSFWMKAADLNHQVEPGATVIDLGTLTIRGDADGECEINVTVDRLDDDSGYPIDASVSPGTLTVGPTAAVFRVTSEGDVLADGPYYGQEFYSGSADVAEWVPISEPVEPGDVLELDPENPGQYRKSRGPCSTLVAGVVSTEPGFILGADTPNSLASGSGVSGVSPGSGLSTDDSRLTTPIRALLALIGIIPVKATTEGGPIEPGDLLVSSSTSGYAMRWDQKSDSLTCSFVGKALEPLTDESGLILVLLMAH